MKYKTIGDVSAMNITDPIAAWAHPGDIECQETDTGVLLTLRQPKHASFAIQNKKGFILQIFTDPNGELIKIIKPKRITVVIEDM